MSSHVLGHHNVVVDSCWTLLPLFTLSAMLAAMVNKNSALFYVAFMDEFGVSHQAASWPITMHGVVTHLTGLLVSLLQKKLSTYQITVSGCLLNFTALVASAFAPTIVWMTITLGVIAGVGYGMIVLSLSIYAMVYFDKYRGTASGFKYTGMTLAPLAFPLALSALIRLYNLSGTLLLLSAITLHTLPLAMLMNNPRPVTCWCTKKQRREALAHTLHKGYGTKGECVVVACKKQKASLVIYRQMSPKEAWQEGGGTFRHAQNGTTGNQGSVHKRTNHAPVVSSDTARVSRKSFEEHNDGLIPKAPVAIVFGASEDRRKDTALSSCDENQGNDLNGLLELGKNPPAIETKESNVNKGASSKSESTNTRDLLRNPLLYLLVAAFTANEYTTDTFEMTVLDYAIDKGTERSQAEPIITYVAAAQLVGRLSVPFLWESARLRRSLLVALSLTVAAISLVVMPHVHSFTLVLVTSLTMGCSSGCVVVLKPVLLSDHLGVQMLPFCWGLAGVAMVPFSLGGSLLIGLFRDTMGSYDNLYRTLSAFCFVFAIMLFILAFFERRAQKRLDNVKKLNETHIGQK
ncbi:uncharacterized protein LOC119394384 [Rhipicephalus sanguineus]|uniref:uncharacterized protein LOC119394384 n=1 Tax=Rhipicephalus sanguineus TaxID=34632 RepID=UPI001892F279|nr:uncharacterized protein LOC119394384 [Rhipicephalus sanguineus]